MKVLIVDDSKVILKMAEDLIKANAICDEVHLADSGDRCLALMAEAVYDVVLLDIIMPGLNGLDVLKEIVSKGYLESMKVVMFTSISDRNALKESFELGAFDYIGKPIEPIEFIARVKGALRQRRLEKDLVLQIEQTRQKNIELKTLYDELRRTQSQMIQREQMAGIGQLAAGVAHEINNPLGYITSNLETLKNYLNIYEELLHQYKAGVLYGEAVDQKRLDFMEEDMPMLYDDMRDGLNRVRDIVNGIRFFSRIDSNTAVEFYDINKGIESVLLLTASEHSQIQCITDFEDLPEAEVVASEINKSLLNIILNSFQAIQMSGRSDGQVHIWTQKKGETICIFIEDNGCGIPEEHLEDVFNPFFTTKPVGSGSGLGLSVVYETVVNKHHGHVSISSELGEWTKVTVCLPIVFSGLQS